MGLFQNLLDTYEKNMEAVGKIQHDTDGNTNEKKTLLPIGHTTFKSEIEVTINEKGEFVKASRDHKETTIIIPCTESSAGRSSGIAAHPLCDQLDYVGGINEDKTRAYLDGINKEKIVDYLGGLSAWKDNHAELKAIYQYVESKTMLQDLLRQDIFKESEFQKEKDGSKKNELDKEKIRKIGVRFIVILDGEYIKVWENNDLREAWIHHISGNVMENQDLFDYMSGAKVTKIATQHPKNINSMTGNAKLFSCNDSDGCTFRGRFRKQDDAVIVDSIQSQKMHQMLRWLIANYGYTVDSQVIVTWAIDNNTAVEVKAHGNTFNIFESMSKHKTNADIISELKGNIYGSYAENLKKLLQGYGNANNIKQHNPTICIAVFDAATTGRMGLVFYQELPKDVYLESIIDWHTDASYYMTAWQTEKDDDGKEKSIPIHYIGAPSYDDIISAVYGKSRGDKSYDTLKKKMRKQLLECMFGNHMLPRNMVEIAANRVSRPMSFTDMNGKFSENDWKRSINVTCALARKLYKQEKEKITLELETGRTDRDYLYGRLLAVADKIEDYAFYKVGKQGERATNATKMMAAFQVKPYSTWGQLYNQLIPYKNQLQGSGGYKSEKYYQSIIDEIMELFQSGDFENNKPLSPLYLLGYSAQNIELNKKIEKNKNENTEEI